MNTISRLKATLRPDLTAGLTVAMVGIPQSLAYASIASVNPIYGVYTAIVPTMVGALFGSSRYLATGPTNATALVTLSVLAFVADSPHYPEYVFALAVLAGIFKLVLGLLRLGSITRFVSNSVLTGFLSAIGIIIAVGQLGNLLGIRTPGGAGVFPTLLAVAGGLGGMNPFTVITAAVAAAVMLAAPRIHKNIPAALLAILVSGVLAYLAGWHEQGVRVVRDLGLPANPSVALHLPQISLEALLGLVPLAGSVAIFSLVEAVSIAKALSKPGERSLNVNREFIGQGLATIAGGFTQCLPASGSPSRSAILVRGGAQTRLAAVLSGLFMWGLLVLFIGLIERIPIAALAAVVIISAIGLINPTQIRFTWRAQTSSRVVMLATFAAALLLPLQYAIYAGVLLSILIYLQESTRLRLTLLEFTDDGQIMERPIAGLLDGRPEVAVLNIEGALYFGAAEQMDKIAHDCLKGGVRVLVLRLRSARNLASTGAAALVGAIRAFQQNGGVVFLSGIDGPTRRTLEAAGITALVGDDHIFEGSEALYAATRRALEAARRHTTREV